MKKLFSPQSGFALIPVMVVVAVLGVTSAGVYIYNQQNKSDSISSRGFENTDYTLVDALPEELLSLDQVKAMVLEEQPESQISTIELENGQNGLVYRVRLADGSQLGIDAITGKAITLNHTEGEVDDSPLPANFIAAINFSRARDIALAQYPNGIIRKIELELEHGVVVYSVRFIDGSRVDVNAGNGKVERKQAKSQAERAERETEDESDDSDDDRNSSNEDRSGSSDDDSDDDEREDESDASEDDDSDDDSRA